MTDTIKITILDKKEIIEQEGEIMTLETMIVDEDEAKTWQLPPLNDGSSFQLETIKVVPPTELANKISFDETTWIVSYEPDSSKPVVKSLYTITVKLTDINGIEVDLP